MIFELFQSGAHHSLISGSDKRLKRVQICENRLLRFGDMSRQGDCLKVKNIHL
jgi:hypothetical protein